MLTFVCMPGVSRHSPSVIVGNRYVNRTSPERMLASTQSSNTFASVLTQQVSPHRHHNTCTNQLCAQPASHIHGSVTATWYASILLVEIKHVALDNHTDKFTVTSMQQWQSGAITFSWKQTHLTYSNDYLQSSTSASKHNLHYIHKSSRLKVKFWL